MAMASCEIGLSIDDGESCEDDESEDFNEILPFFCVYLLVDSLPFL